jgi:hypothetical protein
MMILIYALHHLCAASMHFGHVFGLTDIAWIYRTINSDQLSEPQCLILAIQRFYLGKKKLRGHIGRVNILDAGRFR